MTLVAELRRRAKTITLQVLAASVVGYFAYHAVQGEHGILRLLRLNQDLRLAEAEEARLAAEHQTLQRRVRLMRPDSLDPDMLEERALQMLNFGRDSDFVILTPEGAE